MAQHPIESRFRPVDPILQGIVSGIANDPGKFMTSRILPGIDVGGESSGTIMTLANSDLFGDFDANYKRQLGATAHEAKGPELGNLSYRVQEYAAMITADLKQLSRSQLPQQVELKSLLLTKLMNDLMIAQERRMGTFFNTAATWTSADPGTKWDVAGSDPLSDIEVAVETVAGATGSDPDTMVISRTARRLLQKNDTFLEFLPLNSDRGFMEADAVKSRLSGLFGVAVDRIFYVDARYNSVSADISGTNTLLDCMPDGLWVGKLNTTGVQLDGGVTLQPTAAARFVEHDFEVSEWDDPARNSVWQKVAHSEQIRTVTPALGYLISNTDT